MTSPLSAGTTVSSYSAGDRANTHMNMVENKLPGSTRDARMLGRSGYGLRGCLMGAADEVRSQTWSQMAGRVSGVGPLLFSTTSCCNAHHMVSSSDWKECARPKLSKLPALSLTYGELMGERLVVLAACTPAESSGALQQRFHNPPQQWAQEFGGVEGTKIRWKRETKGHTMIVTLTRQCTRTFPPACTPHTAEKDSTREMFMEACVKSRI
ncbi:hypothetical protein C8Q74DRAFT_1220234 [Fomes fomentarius]|nr:hypothetical protein C8Q74DRAFT_1220234 [Fomes fomentarius]